MLRRRAVVVLALAASSLVPATASSVLCAAPAAAAERSVAREPGGMAGGEEVPEGSRKGGKGFAATIPTWVHVISAGDTLAEGNVPTSQVQKQMAVLDRSFSGALDGWRTGFSFDLVGVTRTVNREWFEMGYGSRAEREAKAALRRGGADTLNVYVTAGGGYLGWATFPSSYRGQPLMDGIVVHYGSLPGGHIPRFDMGLTATHEVGHWLGLFHTFQNGCSASGDRVEDTPPQRTPSSGCPEGKDTCSAPGEDPIRNFMDYSDDACYEEFTEGQSERMREQFLHYRAGEA